MCNQCKSGGLSEYCVDTIDFDEELMENFTCELATEWLSILGVPSLVGEDVNE